MININEWNKSINYNRNDIVLFHNKIYIATKDNIGILPPPVFNYSQVRNSLGQENLISTNIDSLLELSANIFPDNTSDELESHLNYDMVWIASQ